MARRRLPEPRPIQRQTRPPREERPGLGERVAESALTSLATAVPKGLIQWGLMERDITAKEEAASARVAANKAAAAQLAATNLYRTQATIPGTPAYLAGYGLTESDVEDYLMETEDLTPQAPDVWGGPAVLPTARTAAVSLVGQTGPMEEALPQRMFDALPSVPRPRPETWQGALPSVPRPRPRLAEEVSHPAQKAEAKATAITRGLETENEQVAEGIADTVNPETKGRMNPFARLQLEETRQKLDVLDLGDAAPLLPHVQTALQGIDDARLAERTTETVALGRRGRSRTLRYPNLKKQRIEQLKPLVEQLLHHGDNNPKVRENAEIATLLRWYFSASSALDAAPSSSTGHTSSKRGGITSKGPAGDIGVDKYGKIWGSRKVVQKLTNVNGKTAKSHERIIKLEHHPQVPDSMQWLDGATNIKWFPTLEEATVYSQFRVAANRGETPATPEGRDWDPSPHDQPNAETYRQNREARIAANKNEDQERQQVRDIIGNLQTLNKSYQASVANYAKTVNKTVGSLEKSELTEEQKRYLKVAKEMRDAAIQVENWYHDASPVNGEMLVPDYIKTAENTLRDGATWLEQNRDKLFGEDKGKDVVVPSPPIKDRLLIATEEAAIEIVHRRAQRHLKVEVEKDKGPAQTTDQEEDPPLRPEEVDKSVETLMQLIEKHSDIRDNFAPGDSVNLRSGRKIRRGDYLRQLSAKARSLAKKLRAHHKNDPVGTKALDQAEKAFSEIFQE